MRVMACLQFCLQKVGQLIFRRQIFEVYTGHNSRMACESKGIIDLGLLKQYDPYEHMLMYNYFV